MEIESPINNTLGNPAWTSGGSMAGFGLRAGLAGFFSVAGFCPKALWGVRTEMPRTAISTPKQNRAVFIFIFLLFTFA